MDTTIVEKIDIYFKDDAPPEKIVPRCKALASTQHCTVIMHWHSFIRVFSEETNMMDILKTLQTQ